MIRWITCSLSSLDPGCLKDPPETPPMTLPPPSKAAFSTGKVEFTPPVEHRLLHGNALDMSSHKTKNGGIRNLPQVPSYL